MGFHTFFPSKWFAMIAFPLAAIALVGGLFFLYQRDLQSQETSSVAIENATQDVRQYVLESDQDKDDLPDWGEVLWHTDPRNPDTDGDGTEDGDEVTRGRNPTIPGPDDVLTSINTTSSTTSGTGTLASSTTAVVARELFGTYLLLKQQGKLDKETQTQLITQAAQSVARPIKTDYYAITDLNIVPATTQSILEYDRKMAEMVAKFRAIAKTGDNEIVIMSTALQKRDYSQLSTIGERVPVYEDMATQLRSIPTPRDIAQQQLVLANAYRLYADLSMVLSNVQNDPMAVLGYLGQYQKTESDARNALAQILSYLETYSKK